MKPTKLLLCLVFIFSLREVAYGKRNIYWGVAKNDDGAIVYLEKHMVTHVKGALQLSATDYYKPDGKTRIGTLRSDYARNRVMPTYEFIDLRSNYREGLRFIKGRYIVYRDVPLFAV